MPMPYVSGGAANRADDIVIMDNLGSHKSVAIRRAIRKARMHLLFLPPCSPDLKPIERGFAKLKHWRRHAGARARDTLRRAVGAVLNRVTPTECANDIQDTGYDCGKTEAR